jgi:hypothetical protein
MAREFLVDAKISYDDVDQMIRHFGDSFLFPKIGSSTGKIIAWATESQSICLKNRRGKPSFLGSIGNFNGKP